MISFSLSRFIALFSFSFQVPFRFIFIIPPCPSRNTHSIRVFFIDIQPELYTTYDYTLVDYYHNNTMISRNPTLYMYTAPSAIVKHTMT